MVARRLKLLIKRQGTEGSGKETEAANKEAGMVARRLKLLIKRQEIANKVARRLKLLIKRQEW